MWEKVYLPFVLAAIVGTILSMTEVDAQSTVDDSASCESSTLDEAANLIRDYLKDVKNSFRALTQQQNSMSNIFKKDLADLKAAVDASTEQQNNASSISKKDFKDLKAACVTNRQQSSAVNASSLCESQRFRDFRA